MIWHRKILVLFFIFFEKQLNMPLTLLLVNFSFAKKGEEATEKHRHHIISRVMKDV